MLRRILHFEKKNFNLLTKMVKNRNNSSTKVSKITQEPNEKLKTGKDSTKTV